VDALLLGDKGFLGTSVANKLKRNGQEAFHMFLRCAKKPHEPYYHGPNAKKKCLYLGRYRVVPDAEDGISSVIYTFSSLTPESQFVMAEYDSRSRDYGTDIGPGYYEGAETVANADAPANGEHLANESNRFWRGWRSTLPKGN
jgi:hypothetical protein